MSKVQIVTGHYGAGKTEFCIHLSLYLQKQLKQDIYLADIDAINPYFRSREREEYLESNHIHLIGNNLEAKTIQDIPAISGQMMRYIFAEKELVIDLAGSVNGLKALSLFKEHLDQYELLCVLNLYRHETNSYEKMLDYIKSTEDMSSLKVTGIVHNSHLVHDTTTKDILRAQETILKVSETLNLPIKYTLIKNSLYVNIKRLIESETVLAFDKLIMREQWQ